MTILHAQLGLDHLTDEELATLGLTVGTAMAANPTEFAHSPIDPAILIANSTALAANTAHQRQLEAESLQATATTKATRTLLRTNITDASKFAETHAAGDEAKLRLAGFVPRAKPVHTTTLKTPEGLSASLGDVPGEVDLHWHAPRTSAVHNTRVDGTTDATKPETYRQLAVVTGSKATLTGLTHGATMTFRVVFLGANGLESAPSGAVTILV